MSRYDILLRSIEQAKDDDSKEALVNFKNFVDTLVARKQLWVRIKTDCDGACFLLDGKIAKQEGIHVLEISWSNVPGLPDDVKSALDIISQYVVANNS